MIDQIRRVADLREEVEKEQQEKNYLIVVWQQEHRGLLDSLSNLQAQLSEAEATLRASAIAEYRATGDKAPGPGVAIRMQKKLMYDQNQALAWAIKHEVALKLDVLIFEKIAKASPIDFVTISEEPQATIATDLNKVLKELI